MPYYLGLVYFMGLERNSTVLAKKKNLRGVLARMRPLVAIHVQHVHHAVDLSFTPLALRKS